MQLELIAASTSLVAESHNPSILSPDWIQKNHVIPEPPEDFVHTPGFSAYKSTTFEMTADSSRLDLNLRVISHANLEALQKALENYIQTLRHVPFKVLDFNFNWTARSESGPDRFEILRRLQSSEGQFLRTVFPEGRTAAGLSFCNMHGTRVLRATLERNPEDEAEAHIPFNFHFHLDSFEQALEASSALTSCHSESAAIIERLLMEKEQGGSS